MAERTACQFDELPSRSALLDAHVRLAAIYLDLGRIEEARDIQE